ncbi:MAG TPA: amidohydrolase family protein [Chitinophagales bacterium]|nr:amidohydrolase family protein [Chitinophagales bacterium]
MQRFSADLIHTNTGPPLEDHCVVVNKNGLVLEVIPAGDVTVDRHLPGSLIPGFVNAHCHLELSHMIGLVTPGNGLVEFILELLPKRGADADVIHQAVRDADALMYKNGIVCVGDIANTTYTVSTKRESKIHYHTFAEALGFREADADKAFEAAEAVFNAHRRANLDASVVAHAPYSMSRRLLEKIAAWNDKHKGPVGSIHFLESVSEVEFCTFGTGEVNRVLEFFNYPTGEFVPYGESGPAGALRYLTNAGRMLLVHNTYANGDDIGRALSLFNDFAWLVTCPKANLYIEDELPEYPLWRKHTRRICIGTDSLASNNGLSIWDEMKTIHRAHPEIPFEEMLLWGTLNGAQALRQDERFGKIAAGMTPGLVWLEHQPHQPVWESNDPVRAA